MTILTVSIRQGHDMSDRSKIVTVTVLIIVAVVTMFVLILVEDLRLDLRFPRRAGWRSRSAPSWPASSDGSGANE